MKKNLVVTLANKKYIEQAKQFFSSVYLNSGWDGDYMLLAHEVPEKDLKWFKDRGVLIYRCDSMYDDKLHEGKYKSIVFSKLYLFSTEFKKWDRIIFMDADFIVHISLDRLKKVKGFGAVGSFASLNPFLNNLNLYEQIKSETQRKEELLDFKEYNLLNNTFNTGFFVIETSLIKKDTFEKLKQLTKKYLKYCKYGEELILNLFFHNRWERLNIKYNYPADRYLKFINKRDNMIPLNLHFLKMKDYDNNPWNSNSPFYKDWLNNLEKSENIDFSDKKNGSLKISPKDYLIFLYQNIFTTLYFIIDIIIIRPIKLLAKNISPRTYQFLKNTFKTKKSK